MLRHRQAQPFDGLSTCTSIEMDDLPGSKRYRQQARRQALFRRADWAIQRIELPSKQGNDIRCVPQIYKGLRTFA
jgi:hypothetical protein